MKPEATWTSLRSDYSVKAILDAFFGGLIFATLLYVPFLLAILELVTVFMYLLTLIEVLIIISLFLYVYAVHYFWHKSLHLKKQDHATDIRALFTKNILIVNAVILVLGLVAIFVVVPILWK